MTMYNYWFKTILLVLFLIMSSLRLKRNEVNQKFCNILVRASLQHVFHMTKLVQTMKGTHYAHCSTFSSTKSAETEHYAYLFTNVSYRIYSIFCLEMPYHFIVEGNMCKFWISAVRFIGKCLLTSFNFSLSLSKVLYDKIEINNMLNLINKDI